MNKARRKELKKAIDALYEAHRIIEECMDGETEALENLPESIQDSERGEAMAEYIDVMESVIGDIENALDDITNISEV